MRIWTVHPRYLDRTGLLACWRECLLAQAVLNGTTRGYHNHPQLARFLRQPNPLSALGSYLRGLAAEAAARGYNFDTTKILAEAADCKMSETLGQLQYEWRHLLIKLEVRSPFLYKKFALITKPDAHPLFEITEGPVQGWEKQKVAEVLCHI